MEAMDFPLLGEPLALDLANTVVRERGAEIDLLADGAGVEAWLAAHASQVPPGHVRPDDLRALRDALRDLFAARASGGRPDAAALEQVNRAARATQLPALSVGAHGPQVAWPATGSDAILAAVAQSALAVVASDLQVRACENPECLLHFAVHDSRRRFCSTARCANRARQARHRARRGADG
jgi:predicted RNA-binding Zn ribbon-like protein